MTTSPASSGSEPLDTLVAQNLAALRQRVIDCGREVDSVRIVAVTKTFDLDHVGAAAHAGLGTVGENYVDELVDKHARSPWPLRWHYLGALQTNKIAAVCAAADVICSVARVRELEFIARQDRHPDLYVQLDVTGAAARNGAREDEVGALVDAAQRLGLDVTGVMMVAPIDPALARGAFETTSRVADRYGLVERSMGMSDDLELACERGSTEIRVGRALFGARPGPLSRSGLT